MYRKKTCLIVIWYQKDRHTNKQRIIECILLSLKWAVSISILAVCDTRHL